MRSEGADAENYEVFYLGPSGIGSEGTSEDDQPARCVVWGYVTLHVLVALLIGVILRLVLLPQALLADTAQASRTDFLVFFGIAKAASDLIGGTLADSWGRRPTYIMGWCFGVPLVAVLYWAEAAKSAFLVAISDLLLGLMQGITWGLNIIILMDILGPQGRGLASALSNAAGYFGSAATDPVAAAMVAKAGNASICLATLCMGVLFGFILMMLDCRRQHRRSLAAATTPHVEFGGAACAGGAGLLPQLGCGSAIQVLCLLSGHIVNAATALIWGATIQWMKADGGVSIEGVGVVEAWFTGLKVVAMLGSGLLAYRVRPPRIAAASVATMAWGLGLLAWQASSPPASWPRLLCATGMIGLGVGGAYPALEAAVIEGVPEHRRASVYGAYRMWRDLGFASGGICTRVLNTFASEVFVIFVMSTIIAVLFLGKVSVGVVRRAADIELSCQLIEAELHQSGRPSVAQPYEASLRL